MKVVGVQFLFVVKGFFDGNRSVEDDVMEGKNKRVKGIYTNIIGGDDLKFAKLHYNHH